MVKIAAIDDDIEWIKFEKKITDYYYSIGEYEFLEYTDVNEFLSNLPNMECDVYLLDTVFAGKDEISGLDIGKIIKKLYKNSIIIYITGHVEYAIEAFEVNAFRYILKDMLEKKLPEAYQSIASMVNQREEEYFTIDTENRMEQIFKNNIYYFFKEKKYVLVVHSEGVSKIRASLESIQKRMDMECFLRIDKGCVVNIEHVMLLERYQVKMRNGDYLIVSHPQMKKTKQKIKEYWGKRY